MQFGRTENNRSQDSAYFLWMIPFPYRFQMLQSGDEQQLLNLAYYYIIFLSDMTMVTVGHCTYLGRMRLLFNWEHKLQELSSLGLRKSS